ncbi:hypothetical protein GCM10009801_46620 [Streptomyces albiaxialis]|uniref:Uncharacterized protein n=1 Tax=Streptomyces albiaxialis TaxID=329523 RepID=A0ABP5HRH6_9ACTN
MEETPGLWRLSDAQADGCACVVCGVDFLRVEILHKEVGVTERGPVYACRGACKDYVDEALKQLQEGGTTPAPDSEQDGDGGDAIGARAVVLGGDNEFWRLLRDLRAMAGTEALLTVTDDVPTIKYLLKLTARHASDAADRARRVLAVTGETDAEGRDAGEGEQ